MSEPITWAAVGMAAVSNMAVWLVIVREKRNGGKRSSDRTLKPGEAVECQRRGVKIAVMETKQSGYEENIKEIKRDIRSIKEAVKK